MHLFFKLMLDSFLQGKQLPWGLGCSCLLQELAIERQICSVAHAYDMSLNMNFIANEGHYLTGMGISHRGQLF